MTDISDTIKAKVDQLVADDFIGRGPMTIKINKATKDNSDQPVTLYYDGDNGRPYKPCKSMRRVLAHIWGPDSSKYVGRSLTLYRDDKVKFGGLEVGGIRISHMSDIKSMVTMALTASKANKKPFVVKPIEFTAPDADLIAAGEAAVAAGFDAYKAWGATLTPDQRKQVESKLPEWTRRARGES